MNPWLELLRDVKHAIADSMTWISTIGTGLLAKLSYEIYMKRILKPIQWIAVSALSIFSGYMMAVLCLIWDWQDESKILVPMATLLGEKVVLYMMQNYKRIMERVLNTFLKK